MWAAADKVCWRQAVAEGPAVPKRDAGQITGTNADLRRLSMQKSQEVLLSLGVKEDEIKGARPPAR